MSNQQKLAQSILENGLIKLKQFSNEINVTPKNISLLFYSIIKIKTTSYKLEKCFIRKIIVVKFKHIVKKTRLKLNS